MAQNVQEWKRIIYGMIMAKWNFNFHYDLYSPRQSLDYFYCNSKQNAIVRFELTSYLQPISMDSV